MQQFSKLTGTGRVQAICMIAPTEHLAIRTRQLIRERKDSVDVFVSSRVREGGVIQPASESEITAIGRDLINRGANLLISRKGTQQMLQKNLDIQVVSLNNTLTDYMKTILETDPEHKGRVAFFSYVPISEEILLMCKMLHVEAMSYTFSNLEDSYLCVKQAMKDGATYGIGGAWTDPPARHLGLRHFILENSDESIVSALDVANQLYTLHQEETRKQRKLKTRMEMYQAVLNATHDAIISVNADGVLQVVNPVAERIIGKPASRLLGHPVEEVLPNTKLPEVISSGQPQIGQIMTINKTVTNTNRIPIMVDNHARGAVATFQDVRQLQTAEQRIRLKLHEKGFVAKYSFEDILGNSPVILNTVQIARSYASSDAAVLIHGETGVGKELFAQGIHNASARRDGPFVALNCAAVSNNLLESELFGYEEGAFTGALRGGKEGLFELAHNGTIFLDEIGEIPVETQVELLRVLQEKEIRRVGGSRVIPVNVRVITATNRDLIEEIMQKRFREDLYYRLNVLELKIPPLRERAQDVELLGMEFFRSHSGEEDPELLHRFRQLLDQVGDYAWYGNIRELQSFVERVYILLKNQTEPFSIMTEMMCRRNQAEAETKLKGVENAQAFERERVEIITALRAHPNSMEEAARSCGCSRQTLWRRMKKYGVSR